MLNEAPKKKWRLAQFIPICAPARKKPEIMKNPTRKLKVVEATGLEHTVDAPPILVASSHRPATQPSTDEEWRHPPEEAGLIRSQPSPQAVIERSVRSSGRVRRILCGSRRSGRATEKQSNESAPVSPA